MRWRPAQRWRTNDSSRFPHYTANMKCAVCGDPLPTGKKASARYCQDDCRAEAARNRARAKQKKARHSAAESQDRKRAERPTGRTANREPGGADSEQTLAATTGLIKVRRPRPSNRRSDRSESRNSLARSHPKRLCSQSTSSLGTELNRC